MSLINVSDSQALVSLWILGTLYACIYMVGRYELWLLLQNILFSSTL